MTTTYEAALIGSLATLVFMLAFALGWFIRGWQMQVQMEKSLDAQLALANDLRFVRSELDECRDQFSAFTVMAGNPTKVAPKQAKVKK